MRAEPWLDEIRHGINQANSFGCDYCATTRRKGDVVGTFRRYLAGLTMSVAGGKAEVPELGHDFRL
jgi:hypothetical protein